jgi:Sulfatase-modifying factor enzyme 1
MSGKVTPHNRGRLAHFLVVLFPVYLALAAELDPHEVTNREYVQFVVATNHPPPEYWANGKFAAGEEDEPVVLVSWHDTVSYCQWAGSDCLPLMSGSHPVMPDNSKNAEISGNGPPRMLIWQVKLLRRSVALTSPAIAPIATIRTGKTTLKVFAAAGSQP